MKSILRCLGLLCFFLAPVGYANEVEVVEVKLIKQGKSWQFRTTLRHADTGWKHYADGWRVVDDRGKVLAHRTLYHPHVDEQPFTRGLDGVVIPGAVHIVFVEAHDKKHGWSKQRVRIDLRKMKGDRYSIGIR
jgi:hypothetical protein